MGAEMRVARRLTVLNSGRSELLGIVPMAARCLRRTLLPALTSKEQEYGRTYTRPSHYDLVKR
jgi:hypothetical protein